MLKTESYPLWENEIPGPNGLTPMIHFYPTYQKATDACLVIFPGGAYVSHAGHEGEGYARLFTTFGFHCFVVDYRVSPAHFPAPLLDARRAMRFVRANAEKFGIDKEKIAVIGSSAGGHLVSLLSTYKEKLDGEGIDSIDEEDFLPFAQILCYPVVSSHPDCAHFGSYKHLLGDAYSREACHAFAPDLLCDETTPQAFIWHTADDEVVKVENAYRYAAALSRKGVPCELHVFPSAPHGSAVSPNRPHVLHWIELCREWLFGIGFFPMLHPM